MRRSPAMQMRKVLLFWSVLAATIAALSLALSYAHVLEAPPRLSWPPELWRETTVFNAQFWLFAAVGAPIDIAAILCPALLAFWLRSERTAFRFAILATGLYVVSLLLWFSLVNPVNAVLATWTPGPLPANFDEIRSSWETGHMAVASTKLLGFVSLILALLSINRR